MTWGEIQIESLKKMFLNSKDLSVKELNTYREDKKYKTYLYAMPQACNEAINYICNLEPIIKTYSLVIDKQRTNLKDKISDFKYVKNIIANREWNMESNEVLNIEPSSNEIIIYYEAVPTFITSTTTDTDTLNINNDCLRFVPLYIAGELYKDDDLTLSTVYMNEFLNNINLITDRVKNITNNKIVPIYTIE